MDDKEKKVETYKQIRTLLVETEEETFLKLLAVIIQALCDDKDTQNFGEYFKKYYGNCYEQWAYCYRTNTGINTNMHLERMYRTIEHFYLKGKTVKRLDKTIHAIMQITKQKLFDRLTVLEKGKVTTKVKELRTRHKKSMSLNTCLIVKNDDESWEVASANNTEIYTVRLVNPDCCCRIVCRHCSSCIHKYSCTCIDACIKWNMCEHIHLKIEEDDDLEEKAAILEEVGREKEKTSFELKKAKLKINFKRALTKITTAEELRIGEPNFKSLKTKIAAVKSRAN